MDVIFGVWAKYAFYHVVCQVITSDSMYIVFYDLFMLQVA
jgi:hypothetical protein